MSVFQKHSKGKSVFVKPKGFLLGRERSGEEVDGDDDEESVNERVREWRETGRERVRRDKFIQIFLDRVSP